MSQSNQTYKTSFTSGGLFQNECVELAVSYLETNDWNTTISQLQADGLTSSPKEKSKYRILREMALSDKLDGFAVDPYFW